MAPQFNTRHTVNANMQEIGSEQDLTALMQLWQPSALFCMNALDNGANGSNVVVRLHNVLAAWGGVIVYRQYDDHEADLWNYYGADSYVQGLAAKNAPWALYNVGNEPHPATQADRKKMAHWYAQVVEAAVKWGVSVILPGGFASGSFSNDELRDLDEMWIAMAKYRARKRADGYSQIALGSHEYAHVDPRFFVDGEDPRILMNPTAARSHTFKTEADIYDGSPQDNYLMLRTENIYDAIAGAAKISGAEARTIDAWITESDLDRMPNVETGMPDLTAYLDALGGGKTYGLPTCLTALSKIYGKAGEEVYADILQWEEEQGYRGYYKGLCHFTWSEHNDHPFYWRDRYGWRNQTAVHHAWAIRLPKLKSLWKGSTVTITPVPKPSADKLGAPLIGQLITPTFINLRNAPTTAAAIVAQPKSGVTVTAYPVAPAVSADGYDWRWCEIVGASGWMARVNSSWSAQIVAPKPIPAPVTFLPPIVSLDVPFQSQYGDERGPNGCGPAALAMLLDWYAVQLYADKAYKEYTSSDVSTDMNRATGATTSIAQLIAVAKQYGVKASAVGAVAPLSIQDELDAKRPVLILYARGAIDGELAIYAYAGAHFGVLVGYGKTADRSTYYLLREPLQKGTDPEPLKVVESQLVAALKDEGTNNAPNQALFLDASNFTPSVPDADDPPRLWTRAQIVAVIQDLLAAGK